MGRGSAGRPQPGDERDRGAGGRLTRPPGARGREAELLAAQVAYHDRAAARYDGQAFWNRMAACLAVGGTAVFVDTGPAEAAFQDDLDTTSEVPTALRRLADGSEHRVVEVMHDPWDLARRLAGVDWSADVQPLGETFFLGLATRSTTAKAEMR